MTMHRDGTGGLKAKGETQVAQQVGEGDLVESLERISVRPRTVASNGR